MSDNDAFKEWREAYAKYKQDDDYWDDDFEWGRAFVSE